MGRYFETVRILINRLNFCHCHLPVTVITVVFASSDFLLPSLLPFILILTFSWNFTLRKHVPFDSCIFLPCSHCWLGCSLLSVPGLSYISLILALESAISLRKPGNFHWTKIFRSHELETILSRDVISFPLYELHIIKSPLF